MSLRRVRPSLLLLDAVEHTSGDRLPEPMCVRVCESASVTRGVQCTTTVQVSLVLACKTVEGQKRDG